MAKAAKSLDKKTNTSVMAIIMVIVYAVVFGGTLLGAISSGFSNIDGSWLIWAVATIASFVFSIKSFTRFDKLPGHKGLFGLIFNLISLILGSLVVFIQPVSDWWYYGAAFILVASVLVTLTDVILAFNVLSTRKLPQFATHTGGDDRA